jgi:hypothetical protein
MHDLDGRCRLPAFVWRLVHPCCCCIIHTFIVIVIIPNVIVIWLQQGGSGCLCESCCSLSVKYLESGVGRDRLLSFTSDELSYWADLLD